LHPNCGETLAFSPFTAVANPFPCAAQATLPGKNKICTDSIDYKWPDRVVNNSAWFSLPFFEAAIVIFFGALRPD
jgi:hypothetical protein